MVMGYVQFAGQVCLLTSRNPPSPPPPTKHLHLPVLHSKCRVTRWRKAVQWLIAVFIHTGSFIHWPEKHFSHSEKHDLSFKHFLIYLSIIIQKYSNVRRVIKKKIMFSQWPEKPVLQTGKHELSFKHVRYHPSPFSSYFQKLVSTVRNVLHLFHYL